MSTTLVVNPGSYSKKYALFSGGEPVADIRFEKTYAGYEKCTQLKGSQQVCEMIEQDEYVNSLGSLADTAHKYLFRENLSKVGCVVVRIVAPGTYFQAHREIDEAFLAQFKTKAAVAPTHVPAILKEIENIRELFPGIHLLGASDSEFHKDLPDEARHYSIATTDAAELDIYRFGYHGLSVSSIVSRIHAVIGIDPERLIVCHVGGGVSVTGVKEGVSQETSMGFAPNSGLPMSSRAGDLDTAALLHLMTRRNYNVREAELYLDTMGGLVGLGGDVDIRKLLDRQAKRDETASFALNKFAYSLKKAIAATSVSLEGIDALVLTGTAALRSSELRDLILDKLDYLGINISGDRNNLLVGKEGVISVRNSPVKVVVMKTDEMGEMAAVAANLTSN